MASCTNFDYKFYNGGWSAWKSADSLHGGYAGKTSYVVIFYFKTPAIDSKYDGYSNPSLSITVPWVRQTQGTSGTLYAKLYKYDTNNTDHNPKKGSTTIGLIPNSNNYDASVAWSANDRQVHTSTFTLKGSIEPNTCYIIRIGCSTNYLQIGYSGYNSWWKADFNYDAYTNVTAGSVSIEDHGNNTFTITGYKGSDGDNNPITKSVLEWTIYDADGNWWKDSSGFYPKEEFTGNSKSVSRKRIENFGGYSTADTRRVAARVVSYDTYGNCVYPVYSDNNYYLERDIKQYIAPTNPSELKMSIYSRRFTIKKPWTLTWKSAEQCNNNSPVVGYRIYLFKKPVGGSFESVEITASNIETFKTANQEYKYFYFDTESAECEFEINLADYGYQPKDTFKYGLKAYTTDAQGNKILSSNTTPVWSTEKCIQNAGIVHVKVDNSWEEGQVWVKADGIWHEADTVNVKMNNEWVESQ